MLRSFLLLLLILAPLEVLSAQALRPVSEGWGGGAHAHESPPPVSTARLATGGAAGWAAGVAVGAALGYALGSPYRDGYFGPGEMWIGAWVGSALGSAVGVHLANRQQGNAGWAALAAFATAPVAALLIAPTLDSGVPLLLAVPAAQIGVSVVVERIRERARMP